MDYESFLISKKIDKESFEKNEPEMNALWKEEFSKMHSKSFEARKLFLINKIRRKYKLVKKEEEKDSAIKKSPKPIIKPKFKR
ncbi:MAG: hypothetical protein RLN79_03990 [Cytophagales bacterium]